MGVRMLNERENDWLLTSLNALRVTDWDDTDWKGNPEITPFDELSDRPTGRDPDEIENESSSPSTEGVVEYGSFFDRTYEDWEYENKEIGVRMVNERENDWLLTWFDALRMTNRAITIWEGIPEMIPFDELSDRPPGRDPDEMENNGLSPLTVGVIDNGMFFDRTYEDWG